MGLTDFSRSAFVCAIALLLVLLAAGESAAAGLPGLQEGALEVGELTRTYGVHVPASASAKRPMPLVVVLHGGGGSGANAARQTGFMKAADRYGFLVVFPDGSGPPRPLLNALGMRGLLTWNAGGCCGYAEEHHVDDVTFIRALVAKLERDFPIDARRVYATGISNGGMMAYRLACEASDLFAAVGPVAAVQVVDHCAPRQPVSVIHIHGSADQNVPMAGGVGAKALIRDVRPPVAETIRFWVRQDGCAEPPRGSRVAGHVQVERYDRCKEGAAVDYYLVEGGGHAWPGGERLLELLDAPDPHFPATRIIWRFFAAHPKP